MQKFEEKPIASGSVSQFYRAQYKGKKVAIKVRHPNVDKYIKLKYYFCNFKKIKLNLFQENLKIKDH